LRRPPSSTPFPYTTLFRSIPTVSLTGWLMFIGSLPFLVAAVALEHGQWRPIGPWPAFGVLYNIFVGFMFCYWAWNRIVLMVPVRSEEHTSELQSRENLVCR